MRVSLALIIFLGLFAAASYERPNTHGRHIVTCPEYPGNVTFTITYFAEVRYDNTEELQMCDDAYSEYLRTQI